MFEHVSLSELPADLSSRRFWMANAIGVQVLRHLPDAAAYPLFMLADGVVEPLAGHGYSLVVDVVGRLERSTDGEIVAESSLGDSDGACMAFHGWVVGDLDNGDRCPIDGWTTPDLGESPGAPWRVTRAGLVAEFRPGSMVRGLAFVERIVAAAEAANHHPDIDLRYSTVRLTLITHDSGNTITDADRSLAVDIAAIAAELGVSAG